MTNIKIKKRTTKKCSICCKQINLIQYMDRSYRGGHYFGKVPLYSKKEMARSRKFGTHKVMMGSHEINVMNKDPKPHGHFEYWECPRCYWGGK